VKEKMTKLTVPVYNQKGEVVNQAVLNPALFGVKERRDLLHRAVVYQRAAQRGHSSASTKTRAEVRGGGKKPWKQKGTGRARAGSIRSPLHRGGGVVFGPSPAKNFIHQMPKKMRRLALFSALSNKLKTGNLLLLDKLEIKGKTKMMAKLIQQLPIKGGKVLFILPEPNPKIELAVRNLPYAKTLLIHSLNIVDLLNHDYLVLTKEAVTKIEKVYQVSKKVDSSKKEVSLKEGK